MYMERIEIPALQKAKPKPRALKLVAGLLFVLVSSILMVPWTIASILWLGAASVFRIARKVAAVIHDTLLYAGEAVVGR